MLVAVATGVITNAAFAQSASESQQTAQLQEVVVTAQKKEENLQTIPISIISWSGPQLQSSGIVTTSDLPTVVPGLEIATLASGWQPHIRGVGTTLIGPQIENPVALYVDDVYYSSQLMVPTDMTDIATVNVLKGPQGTLFGRNTTGGVIQLYTRDPSTTFSGEVRSELDNYLTSRNFLYVTGGLSSDLAANLAINYTAQGHGWGTNLTNGDDIHKIDHDVSVRGKLFWSPSDATAVHLSVDVQTREDNLGPNFRPLIDSPVPPFFPGLGKTVFSSNPYDVTNFVTDQNRLDQGGASLKVLQNLGFAQLVSITAYREVQQFRGSYDLYGTPAPVSGVSVSQPGNQFTQEFQLLSNPNGVFTWLAGAYYFYASDSFSQLLNFYDASALVNGNPRGNQSFLGGSVTTLDQNYTFMRTNSLSGFAEGTLNFSHATRVVAGFRYTSERRSINGNVNASVDGGAEFPFESQDDHYSNEKPTWRVALSHDFADDVMGYLSYSRGFKSGGFNGLYFAPPYQPETNDAFEAGVKSELLDHRIRINSAAFYMDYHDIQVLVSNPLGLVSVINATGAKIYGLDLDAAFQATNALTIRGGLEWLHARFTDFPNVPYAVAAPEDGGLINTGLPPRNGEGNALPYAPDFTFTLVAEYQLRLGEHTVDFNLTNAYNSGYYFEPDNFAHQGSFDLINAAVTWVLPGNRLSLGLFTRNLTNKVVPASETENPPNNFVADYSKPPRTYGLTVRYLF